MKALKYYGPGNIRMEEIPIPQAASGEVVLAVEACGICATDIKTFQRGHPKIRPGSGLGHEISGVIAELRTRPVATRSVGGRSALRALRFVPPVFARTIQLVSSSLRRSS